MIIDASLIEDGISSRLLVQLIEKHQQSIGRYQTLDGYYLGRHVILDRHRDSEELPNNRVVANYAKYITDMSTGYLLGNPVTYSVNKGFSIEPVTDCYYSQSIAQKDAEIAKEVSKFGRAYEIVYADTQAKPKSAVLTPLNAFIVYDNTVEHNKLFGVYYYPQFDIQGIIKNYVVNVYAKDLIFEYRTLSSGISDLVIETENEHYFSDVPMIEYINNREKQGDYEQVIKLIDAYNILQSDRINDKEQFVDAFLFLSGMEIDSEQARGLKKEKIISDITGQGRAEYLSKALAETDVQVLRDSINEDIHKFSLVPDLTDEKFSGNLSGVAIRYKLLAFEQHIKNKERYFEQGLKERFSLYNQFFSVKANMQIVDTTEIDCVFNRNLPVNEYEISQMLVNLKDRVSEETLLGQLQFVTDPEEEVKAVQKQIADSAKLQAESLGNVGGYDEHAE